MTKRVKRAEPEACVYIMEWWSKPEAAWAPWARTCSVFMPTRLEILQICRGSPGFAFRIARYVREDK